MKITKIIFVFLCVFGVFSSFGEDIGLIKGREVMLSKSTSTRKLQDNTKKRIKYMCFQEMRIIELKGISAQYSGNEECFDNWKYQKW